MELRVRSATNQSNGIRDDAIDALIGYDPAESRESRERWTPIIAIRNAAPHIRSGVAIVEIEQFVADVPVGPGSTPAGVGDASAHDRSRPPRVHSLGPLQVLSRARANRRIESPRHYPDNDLVDVTRAAVWVDAVSAYGITSVALEGPAASESAQRGAVSADRVAVAGTSMHNAHLAVSVDAAGHVSLAEANGSRRLEALLEIIDETDIGDLYTAAPRAREYEVEFRGVRRAHRGPLRGELELRYRVVDTSAKRRAVSAELAIRLTLDAGARFLRIGVSGENRGEDHRLRLAFNTRVRDAAVYADAAFGPVRRTPVVEEDADRRIEAPPSTMPLHRYVSLFNETDGATVFSDGLAEYESRDDGAVLITLVRSVGELSKNDLPERPGHAGWPTPTPAAQCLGPFAAELAILLHGPRTRATIDTIERASDDVLLPLTGRTIRAALRVPDPVRGIELVGESLAFSACKPAEQGTGVVLRCVNLGDEPARGRWRFAHTVREAHLARLDETEIHEVEIDNGAVDFEAGPRAIVTIVVR
jgi:hypothetical protein